MEENSMKNGSLPWVSPPFVESVPFTIPEKEVVVMDEEEDEEDEEDEEGEKKANVPTPVIPDPSSNVSFPSRPEHTASDPESHVP